MKKLNVIMAVYNAEKYLSEAVSSVLEQSFDDFLLLCMYEKTSNDASLEILNSFAAKDDRVKIIPNDGFEDRPERFFQLRKRWVYLSTINFDIDGGIQCLSEKW